MAKSFMEFIFIDSEDLARHTDMRRSGATNAETWTEFRSYRRFEVPKGRATFLLDYHNADGDLADTICVDDNGFTAITGHKPKSDKAYCEMDSEFWREVTKEYRAQRKSEIVEGDRRA